MAQTPDNILNLSPYHREPVVLAVKLTTVNPNRGDKYSWIKPGVEGKINFADDQGLLDIVILGSMDGGFQELAIQGLMLDGYFTRDETKPSLLGYYDAEFLDQRDAQKKIKMAGFMETGRFNNLSAMTRKTLVTTSIEDWASSKILRPVLLPSAAFWVYDREFGRRKEQLETHGKILYDKKPGILRQYYDLLQTGKFISEEEKLDQLALSRIDYGPEFDSIETEAQWGLFSELMADYLANGALDSSEEFASYITFS